MRKTIVIGISLLFIIGIASQAFSARKTPCWDLNANNDCDIATEDINEDGKCNVSDCQDEPTVGAIQVYDANDQYLGILLNGRSIFLPNIKRMINIDEDGNCDTGYFDDIYYSDSICSEPGYIDIVKVNYEIDVVKEWNGTSQYGPGRYYTFDGVKFYPPNTFRSYRLRGPENYEICHPISGGEQGETYIKFVKIPEEDIKIDFPVEFPLRYEIE